MKTNKQKQVWMAWSIVTAVLGALLISQIWNTAGQTEAISYSDFEQLVASRILTPSERRRVAYHEMGHALVAASLPGVDSVLKVSIIPRGVGALGYTIQHPTEDRFLLAASELRKRIAVLMGGRAAEVLLFAGDVSTGAADDLQRATDIATEMVALYGMTETVGQRTYKPATQGFLSGHVLDKPVASETTLREIDLSVRDIIAKAFEEARTILARRRGDLDEGAELLLSKEVITAEDFPAIQQAKTCDSPPVAPVASD
jgi:cell division protease FtsH